MVVICRSNMGGADRAMPRSCLRMSGKGIISRLVNTRCAFCVGKAVA